METLVTPFREIIGNINWMKQLEREYDFEVSVFKVDENGNRYLVRVEGSYA